MEKEEAMLVKGQQQKDVEKMEKTKVGKRKAEKKKVQQKEVEKNAVRKEAMRVEGLTKQLMDHNLERQAEQADMWALEEEFVVKFIHGQLGLEERFSSE